MIKVFHHVLMRLVRDDQDISLLNIRAIIIIIFVLIVHNKYLLLSIWVD